MKELTEAVLRTTIQEHGNNRIVEMNRFFEVIEGMVIENGFNDTPQLIAMTLNEGLKVVIGQNRTVIRLYKRSQALNSTISLILPNNYRGEFLEFPNTSLRSEFKESDNAFLGESAQSNIVNNETVITNWRSIIRAVNKTNCNQRRLHHNPFFYKAVMDLHYRRQLLESTL